MSPNTGVNGETTREQPPCTQGAASPGCGFGDGSSSPGTLCPQIPGFRGWVNPGWGARGAGALTELPPAARERLLLLLHHREGLIFMGV